LCPTAPVAAIADPNELAVRGGGSIAVPEQYQGSSAYPLLLNLLLSYHAAGGAASRDLELPVK